MIKLVLGILRLLRPLFLRLGIHYDQMAAIVSAKLTIDDRIEKNGKTGSNTLLKQALLMAFLGVCLFSMGYWRGSLSATLFIFHSYLTLVVITSFMAEYSRLLFDANDNSILERYPVNSRTLLSTRIVSMLSYLYLITLSLSVIPFLILAIKEGVVEALLFLAACIVNTLFSLLFANLFYIGLMRFVSAEKFRKIITYAQTVLVLVVAISYQFMGQFMGHYAKTGSDLVVQSPHWLFFLPSGYFMAFTSAYQYPNVYSFLLAGLGILFTFLLLILTLYVFSDGYVKNASALDKASPAKIVHYKERLSVWFSKLCCRDLTERSGFMLTWRMTRDNLKFKQSILPMILFAVIFVGMPFYQRFTNGEVPAFASLLTPLYMLPFISTVILMNVNFSEQSNLLWIYQSRPLKHPGAILLGSLKAIYVKYFVPFFMITYLLFGMICGLKHLPDLLLAFSFSTLFIALNYLLSGMVFPFTKEKSGQDSGGQMLKMFLTMFLLFILGGAHFFISLFSFGVWFSIPISWVLIYLVCRQIFSISLTKIESHY